MIRIKFYKNDKTKLLSLVMKGHAGAAEIGQDIVCSSASILAYTVAQCVKDMGGRGDLAKKPIVKLESGNTKISCYCKDESYAEALHTFFVGQVGYHLLAHSYPQYVELKMFGEP